VTRFESGITRNGNDIEIQTTGRYLFTMTSQIGRVPQTIPINTAYSVIVWLKKGALDIDASGNRSELKEQELRVAMTTTQWVEAQAGDVISPRIIVSPTNVGAALEAFVPLVPSFRVSVLGFGT
jgi:hypothetical protein